MVYCFQKIFKFGSWKKIRKWDQNIVISKLTDHESVFCNWIKPKKSAVEFTTHTSYYELTGFWNNPDTNP